ncbi:L-asparaginase-like isoform X3 [Branchiostoma floridae]|uniref:asparaginase n=1 Tax=Branchiostoma floridae TaxID=7739 RepID=A0A9J7LJB6_BRAFL|nr:L-asparaginase-like isoform X3 [Branchiostoma floridae]
MAATPPDEAERKEDGLYNGSPSVTSLQREISLERKASEYTQISEAKVLVVFTGGTIGMKAHGGVYVPEKNYLEKTLMEMPMLHDKAYAEQLKEDNFQFENAPDFFQENAPLVLPLSKYGKHVLYWILEYDPILDSCNMNMDDWGQIAADIEKNYQYFDGFVILHGTDTMAYTASALSFMFEHLGKPVILTGSQVPIYEMRNDGRDNLLGALLIAGHFVIPEVTLYFNNKLYRGNRVTKVANQSFQAFDSPNLPPLVTMEVEIHVEWDAVFRCNTIERFRVQTDMDPNIGLLRLFPGMSLQTVEHFLSPPMEGVVLQTYGTGNAPDGRHDLLQAFKDASDRGILIVNCTQCPKGGVDCYYATGKVLLDAGVIPGADMTVEAALAKLSYLLAKKDVTAQERRELLSENLRGELTMVGVGKESISLTSNKFLRHLARALQLGSAEEMHAVRDALFPALMCAAAKNGDNSTLQALIQQGGNMDAKDYDGRTPLHIACSHGHADTVEFLLKNGASVYQRDAAGHTCLRDAIKFRNFPIIKLLVKTGANLSNHITPIRIGIELCSAAAHNDIDGLRSWILAGADPNQPDYSSRTALHVAVGEGHVEAVKYLMDHGAIPTLQDPHGTTAVIEARIRDHMDLIPLLDKDACCTEPHPAKGAAPAKEEPVSPSKRRFSLGAKFFSKKNTESGD